MKTTTSTISNPTNDSLLRCALILIPLVLMCVAFLPGAQAVSPAPDGGYPGNNTAEGQNALLSLTTGTNNTAVGFFSLRSITDGNLNTGIGVGTLFANTADQNTATGAGALLSNTFGASNTANGTFTLFSNTGGEQNTAIGTGALIGNTIGSDNTAVGTSALGQNMTGNGNTANSFGALFHNTTGNENTAIGDLAGFNQTSGSNNVYIGSGISGIAGESNACYIASIFGQPSANGVQVLINSDNKLGTTTSSKRFKQDIKPMDNLSEALFSLKPVTFRYKKEIDPQGTPQFGLVAENVEKVNPDLVVRDKEGKPYSVRYDAVNAMLLNEFLKEHSEVQELKKEVAALTAGLERVSAQFGATSPSSGGLEASQRLLER